MKTLLILITTLTSFNMVSAAQFKTAKGKVNFTAKGFPSFITIAGKSTNLNGTLVSEDQNLSGSFDVDLATLNTGMDLRDDHMKNKYLEVKKFPKATLTLPKFKSTESGTTQAMLKLKGIEKPIKVNYTIEKNDDSLTVETKFDLLLSDFNVGVPSFQGITVAKTIKLAVAFKAIKEK